tara:strand:- start:3381 stop:4247 length:867 start_codon:yes stop_codon:yes gene_type:complete
MTKTAPKFETISREYASLWDSMEITRDESVMHRTVERIVSCRAAYEEVERLTGVPWFVVGIMDMREGGGGARKHLHNGDSLKRPTVQVPAKRPPGPGPFTFCQSACDALQIKGLDKLKDWSVERMAYEFERFNGFGYRQYRGIRSPYLWGGTNHQEKGKYIADGKYSEAVMDSQHGCMPLLKIIAETCGVSLKSMYGATPDPTLPSPASNSKAEEPTSVVAPVAATGGVLTGGAILTDPVGITSQLVAVKGNAGQLFQGVSLTTWLVPILILLLAAGALYLASRKASS